MKYILLFAILLSGCVSNSGTPKYKTAQQLNLSVKVNVKETLVISGNYSVYNNQALTFQLEDKSTIKTSNKKDNNVLILRTVMTNNDIRLYITLNQLEVNGSGYKRSNFDRDLSLENGVEKLIEFTDENNEEIYLNLSIKATRK